MQEKPLHILSSGQFDRAFLDYICRLTDAIRRLDKSKEGILYLKGLLSHKRGMLYFTQPSTRTFLSFESALHILGIRPSHIRDSSTSSERKGESIEDSLRTFSSYVDVIVMRTSVPGLCDRIASYLDETPRPVPIINAGSGPDEHPTQSLLDIYTLVRGFKSAGGIEGKNIVMVGDLKRGRTIRSLCRLLLNYRNVNITLVSPDNYRIEDDLRQAMIKAEVSFIETDNLEKALTQADAVYMTRVQDEYDDPDGPSSRKSFENFYLKYEHLSSMKEHCVIMHPFPRRQELDPAIDADPRARYWRQERNGMWVRVALLTIIFGVDKMIIHPEL